MDEHVCLAEQFEAHRPHLRAVAYRMLGSLSEADDVVQESWFRPGLGRIRSVRADQVRTRRQVIMGLSARRRMPAVEHLEHRSTRCRLLMVSAPGKGTIVGRVYDTIDNATRQWLTRQPMFFVATAPNDPEGHINLSPKGAAGAFNVLGPTTVAYVDLVGSGVETVAHLRENGRIVLMFCAFAGPPKIVRLHGQGRVVPEDDPEFAALLPQFSLDGDVRTQARGIVVVETTRIADSCGFVVPRMDLVSEREQLMGWAKQQRAKNGEAWKERYVAANNARSIDGLPGYDPREELAEDEARALSSSGRAL